MDSASDKKSWWEEWKVLVYWALGVIVIWGAMWFSLWLIYYDSSSKESKWGEAGTFGDMFGALSCLFSGLAFAGLIVTIRQQSHDLNQQREEMKNTVAEAKAQTQLMEKQLKEQEKQLQEAQRQGEQQRKQAQISQAIDEFYRRLALISTQEANIRRVEKKQDTNCNTYTITIEGAEIFKEFRDKICIIVERCRLYNSEVSFYESLHNESIMVLVASVATLADDIYSRLFPKDEQGSHQAAQFYARVLMNALSDPEKDILYFISRSMPSRLLKEGVDKLIELNVLREDLITSCFKEAEVQDAYRMTAIPEKYRTQYTPHPS